MSDIAVTLDTLAELRKQVGDALDLAIAAGAPTPLLEKLGAARGLLSALSEVPQHSLMPGVIDRARKALREWQQWQEQHPRTVAA
jgi:hypothetical protein